MWARCLSDTFVSGPDLEAPPWDSVPGARSISCRKILRVSTAAGRRLDWPFSFGSARRCSTVRGRMSWTLTCITNEGSIAQPAGLGCHGSLSDRLRHRRGSGDGHRHGAELAKSRDGGALHRARLLL